MAEGLERAQLHLLFNQVTPRIVGIFLIAPVLDAVVFDLVKYLKYQLYSRLVTCELKQDLIKISVQ